MHGYPYLSAKTVAAALAGVLGLVLFAGSAPAIPMIPKPSIPARIEMAQTIIIVRHRHNWRQERRWRRWQRNHYWRARRYWNRPLYFDEPRYAMLPQSQDIEPPRKKKVMTTKPRSVSKSENNQAPKVVSRQTDEIDQKTDQALPTKAVAAPSKFMSCDTAAGIVAGYAFSNVKPVNCSGATYKFQATRQDQAYSVTMNASDGNLVQVTKQP